MDNSVRPGWRYALGVLLLALGAGSALAQSTGGRITGRVTDLTGAVVPNTTITVTQESTQIVRTAQTDNAGSFALLELPVGEYSVQFEKQGFKAVMRHVSLQLNQVLTLDQALKVGATDEVVMVTAEPPLVDTSTTQLGALIDDRAVVSLPLNSRDTYQFLQLQPGVQSQLGGNGNMFFGSDRAGVVSVNGGRGRSNNFSVNGGDGNDQFANLPAIQPSPDAIEEFRVLTNAFDAEYGRNSGAVINVVTKSGSNQWHGSVFEFFRNKVLNARNYFESETPKFNQNQFGGTLGGPIRKDHTFFFLSYEGRRIRQGVPTDLVTVPTDAERGGDFSQSAAFDGSLKSPFLASLLQQRPGCAAAANLPSSVPTDGVAWSDIFPDGKIPTACMDQTALDLMRHYVPRANYSASQYQGTPVKRIDGDQVTARIDHKLTGTQNLSMYFYFDDGTTFQPLSFFQQAGANVPGFGFYVPERFQQYNITHTWTLANKAVNEFRFNYFREGQRGFMTPESTGSVQSFCKTVQPGQCFADPSNPDAGIHSGLDSAHQGMPFIQLSGGFTIGNNFEGQLPQVGNSFQWSDSYARILGNHNVKFGADVRRMRFDQSLYYNVNGYYQYFGGTNSVSGANTLPDYLLGLPSAYSQGSAQREAVRSSAFYLFLQDSWKLKSNLTFNYGLRWELDTPLTDTLHHVQSFRPEQVSSYFGCDATTDSCPGGANFPTGLVFPGDKDVPGGLTQTYYKAFAPRLGIAWSPGATDNLLSKLTGGPGKSSIRAGWGMFYNPIEQLVLTQFGGEPPFGGSTQISQGLFNTPFVGQDGSTIPNPFNGILSPRGGEAIDWSRFRPILLYGDFQPHMRTQYSVQYNLSINRELTKNLMLQVGYVGSQGHRLLATHDLNYGNAQTCLDLNTILGSRTCGPYGEDSSYFIPAGTAIPASGLHLPYGPGGPTVVPGGTVGPNGITLVGLRRYSSPNCNPLTAAGCPGDGVPVFSSIFAEDTIGTSSYNSLQVSLEKRFSRGLQLQAAYTWAKSIDDSSSFENILNPIDPRANRALSLFDARHRLTVNYDWQLPIPKFQGWKDRLLGDWSLSGILTLQSGFPIRITSSNDQELQGSNGFEFPGQPNLTGKFRTMDPRKNGGYYFASSNFSDAALGTFGNAPRTMCCGPGEFNLDVAFLKSFQLSDKTAMELRAEIFNVLNHTQFYNPDGNISDGADFGLVKQARDPRVMQLALKFRF